MAFDVSAANEEAKARIIPALEGKGAHLTIDDAVSGFPPDLMNERPAHVPYTFWHQLEHMRIAQLDLLEYVRDPDYTSPSWPEEYWPDQEERAGKEEWDRTVELLRADRQAFIDLIRDPGCNVLEPVPHMSGRSILREAILVVDHTAYHLGEFVMGRQVLGAWESALG